MKNPNDYATNGYVRNMTKFYYDMIREHHGNIIKQNRKLITKTVIISAVSLVLSVISTSIILLSKFTGGKTQ